MLFLAKKLLPFAPVVRLALVFLCTEIIKQIMEIQVLDPEYQYYKKDVPEPHDDLEIHKESREEPEPGQSKRKRVDSLRGRIKMLKIIK